MRTPSWDAAVADARRLCAAVRRRECCAAQFADGFDTYSSIATLWETTSGTITFGTAYRRFAPPAGLPGQGAYFASAAWARKNMTSNQQTIIAKVAYYQLAAVGASMNVIGVIDTGIAFQVALVVTAAGGLQVQQGWAHIGGAGLQGQTGPGVIAPGLWYSIEVEFAISTSAGVANVWVNGVQVLNLTGINTQTTSDAYANQVQIGDGNNLGCYFDDFRIWDNTGSYQNAPLGTDSRLVEKLPSGAGAAANFTPNGAAANWQCVDDNPPDGDTTYVSGAASGLIDAYDMPSASFSAAPAMVMARSLVRKDDGATRSVEIGVESSGSYSYGPSTTVGSSYAFIFASIPLDPHTSAPWTAAGADAAQHAKQETA